jgi:hypothetical protein
MAARINMLKLLEEVRGFAHFPAKPPVPRPSNPLRLQFSGPAARPLRARVKYLIKIDMQEPANIPDPVPITFLPAVNTPTG